MSGRRVLRVVGWIGWGIVVEVGKSVAAVMQVLAYQSAVSDRREHLERYRGLFGPWRLAHDRRAGIEVPPEPDAPPLGVLLRGYTAMVVVFVLAMAWVGGVL